MLFYIVTCYTISLFSCIHVINTTISLKVTCTLVATSVILQSSNCTGVGIGVTDGIACFYLRIAMLLRLDGEAHPKNFLTEKPLLLQKEEDEEEQ